MVAHQQLLPSQHSTEIDQLSEYARAFEASPHPSFLKGGTLADNVWVIEMENPQLRRDASVTIRFDVPVAPGRLLTDPSLARDLLTAKIYIHHSIVGPFAWVRRSSVASEEARALFVFLRWRLQRGLPTMNHLRRTWFEEFCESLRADGLEGLQRSESTIAAAIAEYDRSGRNPPVGGEGRFSVDLFVRECGFASPSQISDRAAATLAAWALAHGLKVPKSVRDRAAKSGEERRYRGHSLERYLRVWERLRRLEQFFAHDPPGFLPFEGRADSVKLARNMGMGLGRTPTAPALQTCFLIDRALRWVLLYSQELQTLAASIRAAEAAELAPVTRDARARLIATCWSSASLTHIRADDALGVPTLAPDKGCRHGASRKSLALIYRRLLPGACAVVIAAFSARRAEEIYSLKSDSIEYRNGEPWLRTYIGKYRGTRERIPAPMAVVKAIETLIWLSEEARASKDDDWLFQVADIWGGDVVDAPIKDCLSAFANYVSVPDLPDGGGWSFTPHQFRRFFAVMYYYRYRDRSLTALSHYLLHFDPDSTRTYITEARVGGFLKLVDQANADLSAAWRSHKRELDAQAAIDEVGLEFRVEVFAGALAGSEHMGGLAGVRILADLKRLKADWESRLELGDYGEEAPTLDEVLVQFASTARLEPNPLGHSYCTCRNEEKDLAIAGCIAEAKRQDVTAHARQGPDLRFAADMTCAACPHNVQLIENKRYWEELVTSTRASCASCPGTVLARRLAERLEAAEAHLKRFFPADPP